MTSEQNLLQNEFTSEQRATMGSLNSLFGSLSFAIFAVILGIFADNFGPKNALIIQGILGLIVLIPLYRFKKADDQLSN